MKWVERAEDVWFRSGTSGVTVGIVGGMHGDEPAGAEVVRRLKAQPASFYADVRHSVVLALGSPDALRIGERVASGQPDLNRQFGSEPVRGDARANLLQEVLEDVDRLLDLHQTHRPIPMLGVVDARPETVAFARQLGLKTLVRGAELVYGGAMLTDWMSRRERLGITVELGHVDDPQCVARGLQLADALMNDGELGDEPEVWRIEAVLTAPAAGLRFHRPLVNRSRVRRGEVLGSAGGVSLLCPRDGVVFLPREGVAEGEPAALLAVLDGSGLTSLS